ncbi:MAG: acyl-ACP--UDP-N-acetylglucosamine O-acyltransferase [Alphaproteobacteria bacterium]|nr:acyl-ACP--UDP-N-acetylglucosamine O-acyltransferase [Alphaproteobacteria bacterium]
MSDSPNQSAIHPTAVVGRGAKLGEGARIGAYAVVGDDVVLGDRVRIHPHVVVDGRTEIGADTEIFPFASIGSQPQDLKYYGEPSRLVIGARNMIREHVTMNPGTEGGGMLTSVGNDCLFMVGVHVAHDCVVGDNAILANNATLAGHVKVGSFAILGGLSAVHQFARIGDHAIVGGMTGVEHDVIPYGSVKGDRARLAGLNIIGMRRRGFTREQIDGLRRAYKALFGPEGTLQERLDQVAESERGEAAVMEIVDFIRADSSRSICQPRDDSD